MDLTIEEQLRAAMPDLTRAERQLATHVLTHYPVAALGSITVLARSAEVSTPTVVRLCQKLGFKGYPTFSQACGQRLRPCWSRPWPSTIAGRVGRPIRIS